ncbi:MAG TPA: arginase family protein [Candidatus Dormibacteraeota bacterium]|nr:arginase family protein [Candidatus Dormibacteraeota bacterium]
MIFVPYFMGERSRDGARLADGELLAPGLPDASPLDRMNVLYAGLAERVAAGDGQRVQAGDCVAALGVVAGLQRRGAEPHVVWLDAHGDFNTYGTTPSGFLGGMPLAMMVGLGEQALVAAAGLRPLPPERVWLVGARDLDPGEVENLARADVRQLAIEGLAELVPPAGPLYVHLDVDVVDPAEMPALDYPAPGGPSAAAVRAALDRLLATGRVAALTFVGWNPALPGADRARDVAGRLVGDILSGVPT